MLNLTRRTAVRAQNIRGGPGQGQTQTAKKAIVIRMPDDDAIQRKRERLAAETYEYFWNICPELTEPPSHFLNRCPRHSFIIFLCDRAKKISARSPVFAATVFTCARSSAREIKR